VGSDHPGNSESTVTIAASILYNLVECPQRVALDAFGNVAKRDEISAFVRLLWERGTLFEQETTEIRDTMAVFSEERPCRILSLDGGGAKGLYTSGVLREIEGQIRAPIHERFD
jgi:hypothetical protein